MSEKSDNEDHADPVTRPFVDFWTGYIEQANAMTKAMFGSFGGGADAKVWQRQWFEAVSKSLDAYLRSPTFLRALKCNTDALIKAKMQADELSKEFARHANIPTASDVGALSEQLRRFEDAVLSRLQRVEERLEELDTQISSNATSGSKKKTKKNTNSKKTRSKSGN